MIKTKEIAATTCLLTSLIILVATQPPQQPNNIFSRLSQPTAAHANVPLPPPPSQEELERLYQLGQENEATYGTGGVTYDGSRMITVAPTPTENTTNQDAGAQQPATTNTSAETNQDTTTDTEQSQSAAELERQAEEATWATRSAESTSSTEQQDKIMKESKDNSKNQGDRPRTFVGRAVQALFSWIRRVFGGE